MFCFSHWQCISPVALRSRTGVRWEIYQRGTQGQGPLHVARPGADNALRVNMYFCAFRYIFAFNAKVLLCEITAYSSHAATAAFAPPPSPIPLLHSLCTQRAQRRPGGISRVSTLPYEWRHWLWGLFDTHSHTVQTQLIFSGALGGGCWWRGKDLHTRITDHRPFSQVRTVCARRYKTLLW